MSRTPPSDGDADAGRPSSSGGRLEQHLGAVESINASASEELSRILGIEEGSAMDTPEATESTSDVGEVESVYSNARGKIKAAFHTSHHASMIEDDVDSGGSRIRATCARLDGESVTKADIGGHHPGARAPFDRRRGRRRSVEVTTGRRSTLPSDLSKGTMGRGKIDVTKAPRTQVMSRAPVVSTAINCRNQGKTRVPTQSSGSRVEGKGPAHKDAVEDHKLRIQAGQSNTLVAVRIRPLLKDDREQVEIAKVLVSQSTQLMSSHVVPSRVFYNVDPMVACPCYLG